MSSTPVIGSSFGGKSLNLGQRLAVSKALTKIKIQQNVDNVVFWGKITGSQKDYLIAKSVETGKLEFKKTFYISVDGGVSFSELQPCSEISAKKASGMQSKLFTGNPQLKYGPAPENEDEENKTPDTRLTEEERVAYTVAAIENCTAVVPKGAYALTANNRVVVNSAFKGFSSGSAKQLSSYVQFRAPQDHKTITKTRCRGSTNTTDFLDGIANAKPNGVWSVQTDSSGSKVTIRNLQWLGYEFHTTVGSSFFDGAYFGDGTINQDVALML